MAATVPARRRPPARARVVAAAASGADWLGRALLRLPGVAGAACATAAAWEAFGRPAGLAVAAVLLLAVDRRMP